MRMVEDDTCPTCWTPDPSPGWASHLRREVSGYQAEVHPVIGDSGKAGWDWTVKTISRPDPRLCGGKSWLRLASGTRWGPQAERLAKEAAVRAASVMDRRATARLLVDPANGRLTQADQTFVLDMEYYLGMGKSISPAERDRLARLYVKNVVEARWP